MKQQELLLTTFESQAGLATEVPKKQPARAARLQQRELLFACLLFHTATVGAELRLNESLSLWKRKTANTFAKTFEKLESVENSLA